MPQRDANTLDLNMLRLFVVLYQEKNMRKAASRLHVTQPAISHSLKKLREHFSDQLFVKVPQGLEPTPLAHQIATVATAYIEGLSRELDSLTEFNPAEIEQTLRIAVASPILPCIAGNLYNRVKHHAPKASLEIITWTQQTFDDLSQNKVILGINYNTAEHGKHIISKVLTEITPTYIARKDHHYFKKKISNSLTLASMSLHL
ncbi:LysR family transcriptional regulator [Photobacterium sanctipauli]|nr:LysR family transcriptional regulator [Photobacterium sanctipauli]